VNVDILDYVKKLLLRFVVHGCMRSIMIISYSLVAIVIARGIDLVTLDI